MMLKKGTTISHYKILSKIGKGGMGEVFLAEDTELERKVAVKFLNADLSKDSDKVNRFVQEAKAASALNHPNILTVYEIGTWEETRYIATEYIEGETLRDIIGRKDPMPLNRILKIAIQVAEALSAAHPAGIAHRDIKPENIMVRKDGYVKVVDFGLAKLVEKQKKEGDISLEGETKALVKTNPGVVMGTVSYMSPEQARGKETDARTDIWSLGVVLYEMLSGRLPFSGETINHTIVAILETEPKLLENVPEELQRIVRKTLTKDAEMRYQTARDLLIDLKNLRRTLDIQGELERSVVPNSDMTGQFPENETQIHTERSFESTKSQSGPVVTHASSLEYAVTQAKTHKLATAVVALLLVSAVAAIAYFGFFAKGGTQIESIAVMPFVNDSGDSEIEYLSDGMTETLIGSLSKVPNLSVKARSSVFRYKGKEINTRTIGNELGVQAILTGRVAQRGDQVTLALELVDVSTENVIWSEKYERNSSDLVKLQSEIALDMSRKLRSKLSGAETAKVETTYTADNEAYQLYLKGRFHYGKRTKADMEESVKYFEQAVARDPGFALAYVGIANAYRTMPSYGYVALKAVQARAKAAAQKAIEIDPDLAESHAAFAGVAITFDWDWQKAESEYKRAIELDPDVADIHKEYGFGLLLTIGRFKEAIVELKRALELEPLSVVFGSQLASCYMYDGQLDKALEQMEAAKYLDPSHPTVAYHSGVLYNKMRMYDKAIEQAEKVLEKDPVNQDSLVNAGYAYAKTGQRRKAEEIIERLREISKTHTVLASYYAQIYGALGENDKAFVELENAYQDRDTDILMANVHAYFDDIRDDPRFSAMAKRVGLPNAK